MRNKDKKFAENQEVPQANPETQSEQKKCYIKNNTNQKQVIELDGESLVLQPYEEKSVTHSERELQLNLSSFIKLSILEILIK